MKKPIHAIIVVLVVGTIVLLAGCSTDTKSKSDRISEFFSDLNANDFGSLHTHIHPDNAARNNLKSPSTWIPPFDYGYSFSRSGYSETGSTVTVDVVITGDGGGTTDDGLWTFTMKEDTKDLWYIDGLTLPDSGSLF
jgi:outer membrane murein-binding lipoprotein Lpp